MSNVTLNLSDTAKARLTRLVQDGGYASPEAAVEAMLADYAGEDDTAVDRWLQDVVASRYDAARGNSEPGLSIDAARRALFGSS